MGDNKTTVFKFCLFCKAMGVNEEPPCDCAKNLRTHVSSPQFLTPWEFDGRRKRSVSHAIITQGLNSGPENIHQN